MKNQTIQTNRDTPFRIMFVCLGNICRSPAAEGVMNTTLLQRNIASKYQIDSAGTAGYHTGRPPDPRMLAACASRGIALGSIAKTIRAEHLGERDLVIAMDRENHANILRLTNTRPNHVQLLSDYLDGSWPRDVPDPYYGGQEGFEYVIDMLQAACPLILDHIERENRLPINPFG